MGNVAPEVKHDQDSPTEPGKKSAISESLDELIDVDSMIEETFKHVTYPLVMPWQELCLKSFDTTQNESADFDTDVTNKVILDGPKMRQFGHSEDGKDKLTWWERVQWNKEMRELVLTGYFCGDDNAPPDQSVVVYETHVKFLTEPHLHIEYYSIKPLEGGRRDSGEEMAAFLKGLMEVILGPYLKTKVRCEETDAITGGEGEMSIISDPLDDWINEAALKENLVKAIKQIINFLFKDAYKMKWEEVSATESVCKGEGATEPPIGFFTVKQPSEDEIKFLHTRAGQTLIDKNYKIHTDPLRVEIWTIGPGGKRYTGPALVKQCQGDLNTAIENYSQSSWF